MTMRSPIVAMLWENWRLTRVEAAQRMSLGLVAGAGALTLLDDGATVAFWFVLFAHSFIWFSIAKLNGGKFADGYKPGFPFHLLYPRPVSTVMLVGVTMAYDAVTCLALYLASAAVLGFVFGQPLPVFSVALLVLASHFSYACVQWSTRSRLVQWGGSIPLYLPLFIMLQAKVDSSLEFQFSLGENIFLVLMCVVSFVLTVVGVARQRRGDVVSVVPQQKEGSGGYPDWLVNLIRFPCPTSSATRAQMWFELRSSGLPVLAIGLGVATLIFLLFAISVPFSPARYAAVSVTMFCVPVMLLGLGVNAFGIRRKQGRTYASTFEMTQPFGTARLAALKLFVRTACVLVALVAIGLSVWGSSSFIGAWDEWMPSGSKADAVPGLLKLRHRFGEQVEGLAGPTFAALVTIASIIVAGVVALQATRPALRARYPRFLLVVQCLPVVWALALILLTLAIRKGFGPVPLVGDIVTATVWITGAAMVVGTIYFLWSGLAKRTLTIGYASGGLGMSALFVATGVLGLGGGGEIGPYWIALLIFLIMILAPWSLGRVRHR
jgi:hypothetical protein